MIHTVPAAKAISSVCEFDETIVLPRNDNEDDTDICATKACA